MYGHIILFQSRFLLQHQIGPASHILIRKHNLTEFSLFRLPLTFLKISCLWLLVATFLDQDSSMDHSLVILVPLDQ